MAFPACHLGADAAALPLGKSGVQYRFSQSEFLLADFVRPASSALTVSAQCGGLDGPTSATSYDRWRAARTTIPVTDAPPLHGRRTSHRRHVLAQGNLTVLSCISRWSYFLPSMSRIFWQSRFFQENACQNASSFLFTYRFPEKSCVFPSEHRKRYFQNSCGSVSKSGVVFALN
jgi:hypothetical protein